MTATIGQPVTVESVDFSLNKTCDIRIAQLGDETCGVPAVYHIVILCHSALGVAGSDSRFCCQCHFAMLNQGYIRCSYCNVTVTDNWRLW
jgi:hypothetical protein